VPRIVDLTTTNTPIPRQIGPATLPGIQRTEGREQALVEFGQTAGRVFDEIYRAQKIEEDRVNALRTQDQLTKLNSEVLELAIGDNGYSRLKGTDAVNRPILGEYVRRFDDIGQRLTTELANDKQREKFKPFLDATKQRYQEGILRHLAKERETYGNEVFRSVVEGETQNAGVNWNSPNDLGVSLLRVRDAVEERAETYGWTNEYKDLVIQQSQGNIHAAVVQQAIANGNYRYAQQWFEQNRDSIDGATAKQLTVAVQNGTQKELTNAYNAEYLAIEDDGPALDGLRKRVLSDQTLDESRRNVLVGRIQNRQFVLERRDEIESARRLRILEKGVGELNANTLAGFGSSCCAGRPRRPPNGPWCAWRTI